MQRFFQKVDDQLNICYKGQWYFIKKNEDLGNYTNVLQKLSVPNLQDSNFEEALASIGLFKIQQNPDLKIDKGNVYIKDVKLPKIFTELINNSLSNNINVDHLIKFFKNLIFDTSYNSNPVVRKQIKNLFNSSAYCPDKKSQIVFIDKLNDYKELPFYSYQSAPPFLQELFRKETSIEQLCNEFSENSGKGFQEYVLNALLDQENKIIEPKILFYMITFKKLISPNNLKEAFEKDYLHNIFNKDFNEFQRIHILSKFFVNFTEKKLMSLIKKGLNSNDINSIINKYPEVSTVYDLSKIKFTDINDIVKFMDREYKKIISGDNFVLGQESYYPALTEIHTKKIESIGLTCIIPQTYYELITWSGTMGNCIGSSPHYGIKARKGNCILIGFILTSADAYDPQNIYYTIEVTKGNILQFEARHSRRLGVDPFHEQEIRFFLQKAGLIK